MATTLYDRPATTVVGPITDNDLDTIERLGLTAVLTLGSDNH